jgi:hypothetical protein
MNQGNSNQKSSYIPLLTEIGKPTVSQIISFSWGALDRVHSRFEAIDSKASQSIGIIAVVGGILVLGLPPVKMKEELTDLLLIISVAALLGSALFSLLCLRVRFTKEPPTIGNVIEWLREQQGREQQEQNIEILLLSSLVIDLANAEDSHLRVCKVKARHLAMAQVLQGIGVVMLFIYFILSKIGGL